MMESWIIPYRSEGAITNPWGAADLMGNSSGDPIRPHICHLHHFNGSFCALGTEPRKDPETAFRQAHAVSWLEETKCQSASFLEAREDQMLLEASQEAVFRRHLLLSLHPSSLRSASSSGWGMGSLIKRLGWAREDRSLVWLSRRTLLLPHS